MGDAWSPCDQIKHMKVNFWRWTNKVSSLSMLSPASVKKNNNSEKGKKKWKINKEKRYKMKTKKK